MSRKILLNILILFLLIFSIACSTNVTKAVKPETIHYNGEDHKYTGPEVTLVLNKENFEVTEGLMPPLILENRTLVPVREVFEKLGGKVNWEDSERRVDVVLGDKTISLWIDSLEAKVNDKIITTDVTAKVINNKTMVPARFISEQGGLNVGWEPTTNTVSIDSAKAIIKDVTYSNISNVNCLVVSSNTPIIGYKYFMLEDPYRLILDIENSEFDFATTTRNIDDDLISTIRFGNQDNDVNRIVLDLKDDTDYVVVQSSDKTKLYFAMASGFIIPDDDNILNPNENNNSSENNNLNGNNSGETLNPNENNSLNANNSGETLDPSENNNSSENNSSNGDNSGEILNPNENNNSNENNISSGDNSGETLNPNENNNSNEIEVIPDVEITAIKYSSVSKRVRIMYDGDIEYTHMYLANPDRIVIDIENALLKTEGPKEINLKNNVVTSIRFSQYEKDAVRIVLDLSEKVDYNINKKSSELQVNVTQPTYRNISYKLNSTNAQLTLHNVEIKNLTDTKDDKKNKYTIKFSSKNFDCGEGEITPADEFVDRITINETRIIIYDMGSMTYTMKQSGSDVIVTIRNKDDIISSNEQKIILLDAGHGGADIGSSNGNNYEKTYNLAVLLKLKDLLEEEGYIVYTTRETDVTLTVDDRVTLATEDYPNADLYVSVHHNSVENKNYTGTLLMYCPRDTSDYGITNKRFAQLVQEQLIAHLNTVNRGFIVVKEGDTSKRVLTEVPMPSILCEIAFVSNDEELERIKTDSFQQLAAEAIRDGINEALEEMN